MMKSCPMIVVVIFSILVAVSGCSRDFQRELTELDRAHEQWKARGVQHYKFVFEKSCFCEGAGKELETIVCDELTRQGDLTIDDIFLAAKSAIADGDRSLRVRINPNYSYPEEIAFGDDLGADASIAVKILDFSSLKMDAGECANDR